MTFNRACPSGNVMVELSNGEAPVYTYDCEHCHTENSEKHVCRYCQTEIDAQECEEYQGKCATCAREVEEFENR